MQTLYEMGLIKLLVDFYKPAAENPSASPSIKWEPDLEEMAVLDLVSFIRKNYPIRTKEELLLKIKQFQNVSLVKNASKGKIYEYHVFSSLFEKYSVVSGIIFEEGGVIKFSPLGSKIYYDILF